MALVLTTSDGGTELDDFAVTIEPAARRLANIETDTVQRETVTTAIETVVGVVVMRFGDNSRKVIERVKAKIRQIEPSLKGVTIHGISLGWLAATGAEQETTIWQRNKQVFRSDTSGNQESVLGSGIESWIAGTAKGGVGSICEISAESSVERNESAT